MARKRAIQERMAVLFAAEKIEGVAVFILPLFWLSELIEMIVDNERKEK